MESDAYSKVQGCLLGCAVGDSVGLPAEGLSRKRIARRGWSGKWKHRLVFGRGMLSDDTEHTLMVANALLDAEGEVERFRKSLARRMRWWLVALPAGVGMATAKACVKLWIGVSPKRSGVFSAGNGPAMRSAIIGAFYADDETRRKRFVEASTLMTHSDLRALIGALAVAEAAASPGTRHVDLLARIRGFGDANDEWQRLVDQIEKGLEEGWELDAFVDAIGCADAVSGYVYETVPVALFAALRYAGDFEKCLSRVLDAGGDVDTVGAIAGAICGAEVGVEGIPSSWVDGIWDWPRSRPHIERVADALVARGRCVPIFWPLVPLRNVAFLVVVLAHGVRRLWP